MKINGNVRLGLRGVSNKQNHFCTVVIILMIHGFSALVSTQFIGYYGNHSNLGNHIILGRHLFRSIDNLFL